MERRARIEVLLSFYLDVREGFRDPPNGGNDGATRFGSTWSGVEYTQLRRLLCEMRSSSRTAYTHLVGLYMGSTQVRRSFCPRCKHGFPVNTIRTQHCDGIEHGVRKGRAVVMQTFTDRVAPVWVKRRIVGLALDWLDTRWVGECDLPREIREVLHTRQVVELQRGKPMLVA